MAIRTFNRDRGRAFIINEVVEANEQYITIGSWCPVNIESVGRFTGMFDKNLREIYEKEYFGHKRWFVEWIY